MDKLSSADNSKSDLNSKNEKGFMIIESDAKESQQDKFAFRS